MMLEKLFAPFEKTQGGCLFPIALFLVGAIATVVAATQLDRVLDIEYQRIVETRLAGESDQPAEETTRKAGSPTPADPN